MWSHDSAESVKSALNTRFVMNSTVKIKFERKIDDISEDFLSLIKVPFFFIVKLKRPIGLHVVEGPEKKVYVQFVKPVIYLFIFFFVEQKKNNNK
jgi:hypothetical protein